MTDIIFEIITALSVFLIFLILYWSGRDENIRLQRGWYFIVFGFALLLFGAIIDISDNFTVLDQYLVLGDTNYEAFLEKIVGFMGGFLLLAIGFCRWIPVVATLKATEKELHEVNVTLEQKVRERTEQLQKEIQYRKKIEEKREKLITELNVTLDEMKRLKGILPICSYCKKIRDDKGYWEQVEIYIRNHSEADFSHGICPECMKKS